MQSIKYKHNSSNKHNDIDEQNQPEYKIQQKETQKNLNLNKQSHI